MSVSVHKTVQFFENTLFTAGVRKHPLCSILDCKQSEECNGFLIMLFIFFALTLFFVKKMS